MTGRYGATLDVLTSALKPAILRVGGTQGDYDVYTNFSAAEDDGLGGEEAVDLYASEMSSSEEEARASTRTS